MDILAANNRIQLITGTSTITGVINKLVEFKRIYKDSGGIHPQLIFEFSSSLYYSSYYSLNTAYTYMIRLHIMVILSVFEMFAMSR
jgi:hypothetical protein